MTESPRSDSGPTKSDKVAAATVLELGGAAFASMKSRSVSCQSRGSDNNILSEPYLLTRAGVIVTRSTQEHATLPRRAVLDLFYWLVRATSTRSPIATILERRLRWSTVAHACEVHRPVAALEVHTLLVDWPIASEPDVVLPTHVKRACLVEISR